MGNIKKWSQQKIAKRMIDILKSKGFKTYYADNLDEAKKTILDIIPEGVSIGLGGSITLEQMNILDEFRSPRYKLIDRYQECSEEEHINFYKKALGADYFLTGANAITKNGEIVCTDCSGNRVAAMIFGPDKVIVVVGVNKLVDNVEQALKRIKKIAPINAKRNGHKTPCSETAICENCNQPESMCNYTGIIHNGLRFEGRITVVVVADEVGL